MGHRHVNTILEEWQVIEIYHRVKNGERPMDLTAEYPVGETAISKICRGINWKSLGLVPFKIRNGVVWNKELARKQFKKAK